MGKKKTDKLPNKLLPIVNADKLDHEKWTKGRNPLNLISPFRALLTGTVNCGKTTCIKNIILRADPPFDNVICVHCDSEYTKEYQDLGEDIIMLSEIPSPQEFDGLGKTLLILDDLEYKGMSKEQKAHLDRAFGFVSTHKNVSICCTSQDFFSLPPAVRRMSNVFVIWKSLDSDSFKAIAKKAGMSPESFHTIFDTLMTEPRDSLWIDLTDKSPYPLRKNGFTLIERVQ